MASRQNICYRVLKHHGFLISYAGKSLGTVTEEKKKKETYGQWKKRVLGPGVRDLVVFMPFAPSDRTLVENLRKKSDGEHVQKIFEAFGRHKDGLTENAVAEVEQETYERYSTLPKETLRSVVSAFEGTLEPSLAELFKRLLNSKGENVDAAELLQDLVKGYNGAVRSYRELKANQALQPTGPASGGAGG
jgi:hypothetical protein